METNGLANIYITVNLALATDEMSLDAATKIRKQLELLERYMVSIGDGHTPQWHEVLANPEKYPTLKEKITAGSIHTAQKEAEPVEYRGIPIKI